MRVKNQEDSLKQETGRKETRRQLRLLAQGCLRILPPRNYDLSIIARLFDPGMIRMGCC